MPDKEEKKELPSLLQGEGLTFMKDPETNGTAKTRRNNQRDKEQKKNLREPRSRTPRVNRKNPPRGKPARNASRSKAPNKERQLELSQKTSESSAGEKNQAKRLSSTFEGIEAEDHVLQAALEESLKIKGDDFKQPEAKNPLQSMKKAK